MKALLCVLVLAGSAAAGWMLACRPSACERLDEICARPSITDLNTVMQCSMAAMLLLGERTEAKCEAILDEMARSRK